MLSWLYDIFVTIVSFVMGLFGFDLKKRSVTFADDVKEVPADTDTTAESATVTAPAVTEIVAAEATAVTESV